MTNNSCLGVSGKNCSPSIRITFEPCRQSLQCSSGTEVIPDSTTLDILKRPCCSLGIFEKNKVRIFSDENAVSRMRFLTKPPLVVADTITKLSGLVTKPYGSLKLNMTPSFSLIVVAVGIYLD